MELFAAGFNAWRQLEFDAPKATGPDSGNGEEPEDISVFRPVLTDRSVIDKPYASLAYTLGAYYPALRPEQTGAGFLSSFAFEPYRKSPRFVD